MNAAKDRYVKYLWRAFRIVHDIDDRREAGYGMYYTQKKGRSIQRLWHGEKIKKKPGDIGLREPQPGNHTAMEPNFVSAGNSIITNTIKMSSLQVLYHQICFVNAC